ncbi:MAG: STAS domain-containing protein [Sulfuricella sp.]|nr:STAS domain-containing protein [Sulfuricella sp.]
MISGEQGRYRIDGAITMNNANAVLEEGLAKFGDAAEVDLSALGETDSAAVSLLLEWRRVNPALKFIGCPDNLKSLVTLYGVLELVQ